MEIRTATEQDVDAIVKLDDAGGFEERVILKYLSSIDYSRIEKTTILLAIDKNTAIGKAEVVIGKRRDLGRIGCLRKIVVMPEYRNKGVATMLIKKAFDICRKEGANTLDLHVIDDNATAIALYEKLGFKLRHKESHMRKKIKLD